MSLKKLIKQNSVYSVPQLPQYLAVQPIEDNKGEDNSLENLLHEKVRSLSDILAQIALETNNREELSLKVIDKIYRHYIYLKSKLFELYGWEPGINKGIEIRRSKLEKELNTLNQEKRQEDIQCWQDIALLKKEFRDWFKQYSDLLQRVKIIVPKDIMKNISKNGFKKIQNAG